MLNPAEKLLTVTDAFADRQVALMIADKLISYSKTEVYRFRINHDIRPPKCLPCPVVYDWASKDYVGIELSKNKMYARQWLTDAALHGYKIEEVDAKRKPTGGRAESIDIVRKRAEYHQRPKPENDDDIPF